jgi:hypothetical protein
MNNNLTTAFYFYFWPINYKFSGSTISAILGHIYFTIHVSNRLNQLAPREIQFLQTRNKI